MVTITEHYYETFRSFWAEEMGEVGPKKVQYLALGYQNGPKFAQMATKWPRNGPERPPPVLYCYSQYHCT